MASGVAFVSHFDAVVRRDRERVDDDVARRGGVERGSRRVACVQEIANVYQDMHVDVFTSTEERKASS